MKIIIGLGNPGQEYEITRHNAGFIALNHFVSQAGLTWEMSKKFKALIAKDSGILYAKPQTFMNESGQSALAILDFFKLLPKKIGLIKSRDADLSQILTVIHDEIDLPLGKWKESIASRSAGHRGVESIIAKLKTKNFRRLRLGIKGDKPEQMPARDYVLQKFSAEELEAISQAIAELEL